MSVFGASVQKDNTHLFENDGDVKLSEKDGRKIIEWANSGVGYTPPVRNSKSPTEVLTELQESLFAKIVSLGGSKNKEMIEGLQKIETSCNPKKVKDLAKLKEMEEYLNNAKPMTDEKETK